MPTDRPMDGIDMSAFMFGQTEESGRDSFVFMGTDGDVVSVKWKTMKVHFRLAESDSWTAPLVKPQVPAIYDLVSDPSESVNLMESDLTVGWVLRAAMEPLIEIGKSAAEYPHIPPGADFEGYERG